MRRLFLLSLLVLFGARLGAEEILGNADVVALVQAHLGSDVVLAKIANTACRFDTSTEALIALKKAGVPDEVVAAMVKRASPAGSRGAEASAREVSRARAPVFDIQAARKGGWFIADGEFLGDAAGLHFLTHETTRHGPDWLRENLHLPWKDIAAVCMDDGPVFTYLEIRDRDDRRLLRIEPRTPPPDLRATEDPEEAAARRLLGILRDSKAAGFAGLAQVALQEDCP